jgi:hypothetical protein
LREEFFGDSLDLCGMANCTVTNGLFHKFSPAVGALVSQLLGLLLLSLLLLLIFLFQEVSRD